MIYEPNWYTFLLLNKYNSDKHNWYLTITKELKQKTKVHK